ncbi:MAG TPA: nucleotidyltransferase domain-containing protein [Ktedonobacteraceae bacterium]|nr:nucleotidyltransferase domain-containing protein [Ktedonobacteraceae bacterium]
MYNSVPSISSAFLNELVAEIDNDTIRGIVLGGSHARGDPTPYSDVDLACFVPDTFRPLRKRYLYRDDHLISIGLKTLEGVKQQLAEPLQALWIVPSFRQAKVLLDKDGSMSQLKQMVENFTWDALHEEAVGFAGQILVSDAEFVHKLLGNMSRGNLSGIAYVVQRLFDDATMTMALYFGVFITTDSTYYQEVESAVGVDSNWTYYHCLLSGVNTIDEDTSSLDARGKLALRLYRETATLLLPVLNEQRRLVVEHVLSLIEQAL